MKSHELFQQFFKKHGIKQIAAALALATSYLYKWTHPDGGKAAGGLNPLERVLALIRCTGDLAPLHWLCAQCGGFFVANPPVKAVRAAELPVQSCRVMKELGHLQAAVSETLLDGRQVRAPELRRQWDVLKSDMEWLVQACERGTWRCGAILLPLGWWCATGELPDMVAM